MKKEIQALVETGILVGVAVIFDIVFGAISQLPQGGSISLAMLPIFVLAARRGLKYGLIGGILLGLISFIFKPYFLSFLQFTLDYILAFGVIGLGAFLPKKIKKLPRFIYIILIGGFLRYIMASLAGVAFWGQYIPDELVWIDSSLGTSLSTSLSGQSLLYIGSFLYNAAYLIPSIALCIVVGYILFKRGILNYGMEEINA